MPDEWFDTLAELPLRSSYRRQRSPELTFPFFSRWRQLSPNCSGFDDRQVFARTLDGARQSLLAEPYSGPRATAGYHSMRNAFAVVLKARQPSLAMLSISGGECV